jgi:hypothetical protein
MRLWALLVHLQVNKPNLPLTFEEYSFAIGIALGVTFVIVVCIPILPTQWDFMFDIALLGCKSPNYHVNMLIKG